MEWEKYLDKLEREREGGERIGQDRVDRQKGGIEIDREKENCVLILILINLKYYIICYRGFYLVLLELRGLEFKAFIVSIKRLVFVLNK